MPTRALKGCAEPGCPNRSREARCPKHQRPDGRPPASRRGYGAAWRRLRAQVLDEEPFCRTGCGRASTDVDHIVPKPIGTDERSNLQGLCHRHHSQKTARHDGGFGH